MELSEIKKRRDVLRAMITEQLQDFENETGVSVDSIYVRKIDHGEGNHVLNIDLEIKIS